MALRIEENNGLFEISGRVNSQSVGVLKSYFNAVLEKNEIIMVSIEKVTEMDATAARYFEQFYKEVAVSNKVVHIIGRQNSRISGVMQNSGTDYILSSDRV
jgi:anti-anti-sigma regulatory factor